MLPRKRVDADGVAWAADPPAPPSPRGATGEHKIDGSYSESPQHEVGNGVEPLGLPEATGEEGQEGRGRQGRAGG